MFYNFLVGVEEEEDWDSCTHDDNPYGEIL